MPKDARDLRQLFLQQKPCNILIAISKTKKPYVSSLMKDADTTFAHTTNILSDFESYGLVEFVNEGRMKYVRLTKSGKEIARSLNALDSFLNGGQILKGLDRIERRLDSLDSAIKAGPADDKSVKRRAKRLKEINAIVKHYGEDSKKFNNPGLKAALDRMNERIEYIMTRFKPEDLT
jgi:predicted transcriptional regulator